MKVNNAATVLIELLTLVSGAMFSHFNEAI